MSLFSEYPGFKRVPDFMGLDFDAARRLQGASGWSIRDPNSDAPPISSYWWDHRHMIVASQHPAAGDLLPRNQGIAITLTDPSPAKATRLPGKAAPTSDRPASG